VYALGYPNDSEDAVATVGCIACRSDDMYQLAMSINGGNSGGCVVYDGKVLGIATSSLCESEGICFGVPVRQIASFLQQWLGDASIGSLLIPPSFGVSLRPATRAFFKSIDSAASGALVHHLQPGGSFAKAGLKEGDVLTGLSTLHGGKQHHFLVDCHGLITVPWSLAKLELENLDLVLFCDKNKTKIHFLSPPKTNKRKKTQSYTSKTKKAPILVTRKAVPTLVPFYDEIKHVLFGGIVLQQLSKNHASMMKQEGRRADPRFLFKLLETDGDEQMVVVSHVYRQSVASDSETFEDLTILKSINGTDIKTIEEAETLLASAVKNRVAEQFVHLATAEHDDIVFDLYELIEQEQTFLSSIPHHPRDTLLNVKTRSKRCRR
jgi:hypothetical protein